MWLISHHFLRNSNCGRDFRSGLNRMDYHCRIWTLTFKLLQGFK